jgi:hypothetical protein
MDTLLGSRLGNGHARQPAPTVVLGPAGLLHVFVSATLLRCSFNGTAS